MVEVRSVAHEHLEGERALFFGQDLDITDSVFANGESPLKHSSRIGATRTLFEWKYPLWYAEDARLTDSVLLDTARAGIWYTSNVSIDHSTIAAPKTFRRSRGVRLEAVDMPNAAETLWHCQDVTLKRVTATGDYFAMDSTDLVVEDFRLVGNYGFDGVSRAEVTNAHLISKDAFWNCEDIVVRNSVIVGEYLGWNSRNLTFIDCTIQSLQGLCYIENLVMRGCRLIDTTLAFEYSTVDADLIGPVDSIINPSGGTIRCQSVGELILDPARIDPGKVRIITDPA